MEISLNTVSIIDNIDTVFLFTIAVRYNIILRSLGLTSIFLLIRYSSNMTWLCTSIVRRFQITAEISLKLITTSVFKLF